jgi:hypothetical protein
MPGHRLSRLALSNSKSDVFLFILMKPRIMMEVPLVSEPSRVKVMY